MSTYDTYEARLDPTPRVYKHSGPFGKESLKSVAEAVAFCERKGLDPAMVSLAHNYVMWDAAETAEEVTRRVERAQADRQSHVDRIREMYEEYAERGLYATPTQPPSSGVRATASERRD